ncbi:MAG: hypothetical protein IKH51_10350 [Clostridia bacterium]|nr:hypothetical protein [Clostridia bacterium]
MKRRINVLGKICRIISMIIIVFLIIGASASLIASVTLMVIPQNGLQADVSGSAKVEIYGDLIDKLPDGMLKNIAKSIQEGAVNFSINSNSVNGLTQSGDTVTLDASGDVTHLTFRKIGMSLLFSSMTIGLLIYVFIMLRKLMREFEICDSPFSDGVVKAMTGFAISLIPYTVLKPAFSKLAGSLLTSGNLNVDFSLDLTMAFFALVIILLIFIFKYGASLQKESDETL